MRVRSGFGYWREPLFVVAALLYVANTFWWKPSCGDPSAFVHCYLGDVLCMPVCVPVTLWLQQRFGVRHPEWGPGLRELLLHWLLWSACFEWLGPRLPLLAPGAVADPWDAVAYGAGGLLAAIAWRLRWRKVGPRQLVPPADRSSGCMPSARELGGRFAVAVAVAMAVLFAYRFGALVRSLG